MKCQMLCQKKSKYALHFPCFRYEQDPQGNAKEKASILCPEIDDVFGLKLHTFEEEVLC